MTTSEDPDSGIRQVITAINNDPDTVGRILGARYGAGEPGSGSVIYDLIRGIYQGTKDTAPLGARNPHLAAAGRLSDAALRIDNLGRERDLAHRDHQPDPAYTRAGLPDPHQP